MFLSQDSSLKFWDTRSGNSPSNEIKLPGKVASLDVSKNGCYVLACSRDNSIHLFDVRMGGGARNGPVSTFTADGFQVSTKTCSQFAVAPFNDILKLLFLSSATSNQHFSSNFAEGISCPDSSVGWQSL